MAALGHARFSCPFSTPETGSSNETCITDDTLMQTSSPRPMRPAPALLVVHDSPPVVRKRSGSVNLEVQRLSPDRAETPELERLDLNEISTAITTLLTPQISLVLRALRITVSEEPFQLATWCQIVSHFEDKLNARQKELLHDKVWQPDEDLNWDTDSFNEEHDVAFLYNVVSIAAEITKLPQETLLEKMGESHASYRLERHHKALQFLGSTLADFFVNMESLNQLLRKGGCARTYPHCVPHEHFIRVREEHGRVVIQCTALPCYVADMFPGLIRRIAQDLFTLSTRVSVVRRPEGDRCFVIQSTCTKRQISRLGISTSHATFLSTQPEDLPVGVLTMCQAFPFHFMCDRRLTITQLGVGFMRMLKLNVTLEQILCAHQAAITVSSFFDIVEPQVEMKFDNIIALTNISFVLRVKNEHVRDEKYKGTELRGQMIHCPESNSLMFLASPIVDSLNTMIQRGLYMSDVPIHDATRNIIMVEEQSRAQDGLKRRLDKLKNIVQEANLAVEEERQKNVDLLHLIFPPHVARSLWLGETVEAQQHDHVTLLFSDIVDFTRICSITSPMMVISLLNQLYTEFDHFCGQLDVYKIETVGDAYCVASGLRKPTSSHAPRAAWMALKMMQCVLQMRAPDGQKIEMRVGIHSGMVLAGVVGTQMPRYCLIGNDVALANKFECRSQPMRINVSPTTHKYLINMAGFSFTPQPRSNLPEGFPPHVKGTCYFLDSYKHPSIDANECLDEHIKAGKRELKPDTTNYLAA